MIKTNITVVKVIYVCLGSFSWNMDKYADPDQMPHSVATDQGLHCLNIYLNKTNNNTQQILAFESIHPLDEDVIFHWA